mgnify:CR=1 FL=1
MNEHWVAKVHSFLIWISVSNGSFIGGKNLNPCSPLISLMTVGDISIPIESIIWWYKSVPDMYGFWWVCWTTNDETILVFLVGLLNIVIF